MYRYSLTSDVDIHGMEWGYPKRGSAPLPKEYYETFEFQFYNAARSGPAVWSDEEYRWRYLMAKAIKIKPIGAIR